MRFVPGGAGWLCPLCRDEDDARRGWLSLWLPCLCGAPREPGLCGRSAVAHLNPIFCSWAPTNTAAAPPSLAPAAAASVPYTRRRQQFPWWVPCETVQHSAAKTCRRAAAPCRSFYLRSLRCGKCPAFGLQRAGVRGVQTHLKSE